MAPPQCSSPFMIMNRRGEVVSEGQERSRGSLPKTVKSDYMIYQGKKHFPATEHAKACPQYAEVQVWLLQTLSPLWMGRSMSNLVWTAKGATDIFSHLYGENLHDQSLEKQVWLFVCLIY